MAATLKEQYFNKTWVKDLSSAIHEAYPEFEMQYFEKAVLDKNWNARELKDRIAFVVQQINTHLPLTYPKQIGILRKVQGALAPKEENRFGFLVFSTFVEVYGIDKPAISIKALEFFTKYCTAEFAIRPFIERYPNESWDFIYSSCTHKNEHVRRLASEGCRPRLPWAPQLKGLIKDPKPIFKVLDKLKTDESLYVRRSVANNLNDISKDHPGLVLKWAEKNIGKNEKTDWIIKHALRSLLKKGDPIALQLFGYKKNKNLKVKNLSCPKRLKKGDRLSFGFSLENASKKEALARLEYIIEYAKANNKTSSKVFQISERTIKASKEIEFKSSQSFKDMSTRKHYTGKHKITIVCNGEPKISANFELVNG